MALDNDDDLLFTGYSIYKRAQEISSKVKSSSRNFSLEFMGKQLDIPIIDVRLELPIYRLTNIRTRSLQDQYLALHSELPSDFFKRDKGGNDALRIQHDILFNLINDQNLLKIFQGGIRQDEPIICSADGVVVNGNRRLCTWRHLFSIDKNKYKYFETIRIAVLPACDERAIQDIEIRLQIKPDIKADYKWHAIANSIAEDFHARMSRREVAHKYEKSPSEIVELFDMLEYARHYLERIGNPRQWSMVDDREYAFREMVKARKKLTTVRQKEQFEQICFSLIEEGRSGRLYQIIPLVQEFLPNISLALQNELGIPKATIKEKPKDDSELLLQEGEKPDEITWEIKNNEDAEKARKIAYSVIENQKAIRDEQKSDDYLLMQLSKVSALLQGTITTVQGKESFTTDGVLEQIQVIEESLRQIEGLLSKK